MVFKKKIVKEVLSMVYNQRVRDKLINLEEYINDLDEYRDLSLEELRSDKILLRYLERTLQLTLEAMLVIGYQIMSDERLGNPVSHKKAMKILADNNIIKENIDNYIKMVQFRNILVHGYTDVDHDKMLSIINNNIYDIKNIFKWYKEYIS